MIGSGTHRGLITAFDDVVLAAQAGSPVAFSELHALYSARLYKTIIAITRNPHDAEEALQETFYEFIWRSRHSKVNQKYILG
jgi:DNA-directed RNA polymerase specialized sigma24 family protein